MDQLTVNLVQQSWAQVTPISDHAGKLFYQNLFAADPSLRPLFKGNTDEQAAKLIFMIGAAVGKLNDLATLVPILENLGKRHGNYGVAPAHYQTVGTALLQTLGQGLGDAFTPAVSAAWAKVYAVIATTMMSATEHGK
jgi:hemoglobin-like flavoprotein